MEQRSCDSGLAARLVTVNERGLFLPLSRWYGHEKECEDYNLGEPYSCYIPRDLALFTPYEIWVEASNQLGAAGSDVTILDVLDVGKSVAPCTLHSAPR